MQAGTSAPYFLVQQDAFSFISDWYFDAILELTDVVGGRLYPYVISEMLGISPTQANVARDTLVRLGMLKQTQDGKFRREESDSTTILDADSTSAAKRKHQIQISEKSVVAMESIPKAERDHTSLCLSFNQEEIPQAKALIAEFRREFNKKLGKAENSNSVYQLQISFFPLTKSKGPAV
jgi:uncharacterized protein (TIGR02147 family)